MKHNPSRHPFLRLLSVVFLCLLGRAGAQTEQDLSSNLFHFGFSAQILNGFNENDANAAAKTWIQGISKERSLPCDPNPEIFQETATMLERIKQRRVDALLLTMTEYWAIYKEAKFARMVTYIREHGDYTEKYLLLARKESNIRTLDDLKNKKLLILQSPRMSLSEIWLDTILMENGSKPSGEHFASVSRNTRLNKVVLPVFFRQVDACLITQSGFKIMGELNPQTTAQMQIIATSPFFIPSGTFFRPDCQEELVEKAIQEMSKINTTTAGRQLLTVFQVQQIKEIAINELSETLQLLDKHEELRKNHTQPKLHAAVQNKLEMTK